MRGVSWLLVEELDLIKLLFTLLPSICVMFSMSMALLQGVVSACALQQYWQVRDVPGTYRVLAVVLDRHPDTTAELSKAHSNLLAQLI